MKWIAPNYRPEDLFTCVWERKSRVFFLFFALSRQECKKWYSYKNLYESFGGKYGVKKRISGVYLY